MPSDSPAAGARRPLRIGKYEVLAHIATGGMGAVYRARDVELDREVALKILTPEMASNPGLLERFRREARHAAKLHHENIVTLYEFGEAHGTYFLAMEFVDGIDLLEYIKRKGPLDPEESLHILIQATRALDHAHQQKIVHRDIKPSNFLVTRKDGELLIKLTDMGLARKSHDKEARVTRHGNTVGTVDYIAPEQAKDSGAADIRSDIYSLGCTWYHMLAGKAPFPEGSIAERIYKHIEAEPADVRQLNPKVTEALAAVLERMMAKDPDDRYQTPAELLKDLERGRPARSPALRRDEAVAERDVLAGLAQGANDEAPRHRSKTTVHSRAATGPRLRAGDETDESQPASPRKNAWLWVIGGTTAILMALIIVAVLANHSPSRPTQSDDPGVVQKPPGDDSEHRPDPDNNLSKKEDPPEKKPNAEPAKRRWLYPAAATVDAAPLGREWEEPWARDIIPADTPVLRVSRFARLQKITGDGPRTDFDSLAAACAAVPLKQLTIIEICDNGPLFLPGLAVKDRHLVVRAGKGYRPLLAWDLAAGTPDGRAFLSLSQGNLTLENLDVVVQRTTSSAQEAAALFQVADGDFLARGCTFSVAGKHRAGVALVRLDSDETGGAHGKANSRCRLSRCYARGASLVALDLRSRGADVLLDDCLIVGGDPPLVQVAGRNAAPVTLRAARSTLVAGQTLLQLKPATATDTRPALKWLGWDTLLARSGDQSNSVLADLRENAGSEGMEWRAVNCYYAGWKTLLAGPKPITCSDHSAWRQRWQLAEGDGAAVTPWPAAVVHDPAEIAPGDYRTADTPVGFAATSGKGTLGCDVSTLPPVRDNWLALTYDRFAMPALEVPTGDTVPEIPTPNDGHFHGAKLDLNKIDLGAYLQDMQKTLRLGPRVVLHLTGSGERRTSPVRVKGSSLVLYFEPSAVADTTPLVLVPSDKMAGHPNALIEVEDGDLEVFGGEVRFPNSKVALVPAYALKVRGGELRVYGCRLQGPLAQLPAAYRGLIHFEGSGQSDPERARGCALNKTILLSGRAGIEVVGSGVRLRLRQSVVVCGTDALDLEPGPKAPARLNMQCLWENNTLAAKGAILRLSDVPQLDVLAEPLVVQARSNVFAAPFAEPHRAGLLLCEKESLPRGLMIWQGDGNVYDKRLHFYAATDAPPERQQPYTFWTALWGTPGDRQPVLDLPWKQTLDLDRPQLDRLVLPTPTRFKPPLPGADLTKLGILKKPKN